MPKTESEVIKILEPIAGALKVAVEEIWKIYTKRWLAMGASQMLVAIIVSAVSIWKFADSNWVFAPLGVALLIAYNAINLIINPAYFAINDIVKIVKDSNEK